MEKKSVDSPKKQSPPSLRRAIFSLITIIGVLIFSGVFIQSIKPKIWTNYNLSNSGLIDRNGKVSITAMAFDTNGQLWVGNPDGVFTLTPDGTWKSYTTSNSKLPSGAIGSLTIDNHNQVWVGTTSGLGMLTSQEKTWETLLNERVFALATDQQGQLWVATEKKLSLLSNGQWKDYTSEYSELSKYASYALVVDQDGQVWTTDRLQIDILTPKRIWIKDIANKVIQPRYNSIRALAIDNQNRVWVGTESGLVECINGKCVSYDARNPKLAKGLNLSTDILTYDVRALAFDNNNKLWVNTGEKLHILDIFLASLLNGPLAFRDFENIILFVLGYFFVARQLPKKNNSLIGALGGGLASGMIGAPMSFLPSTYTIIIVMTVIGIIIGLAVGFFGGKVGGKLVAYISGGVMVFELYFFLIVIFSQQ